MLKIEEETKNLINELKIKYPEKKGVAEELISKILIEFIAQIKKDNENLTFLDFYKKYLNEHKFINREDFTNSQFEKIINESNLNERDKRIAIMNWMEFKSEEKIADELMIDRKTVRNNIPKIAKKLRITISKLISQNDL